MLTDRKLLYFVGALLFCFFVSTVVLGTKYSNATEKSRTCKSDEDKNKIIEDKLPLRKSLNFENYRLPSDVIPVHYDLRIRTDLDAGIFFGTVNISIKVHSPRNSLILHQKWLNITETVLSHDYGSNVPILSTEEEEDLEQWIINLRNKIETGNYTLTMKFIGNLSSGVLNGLYMSTYKDPDLNTRVIATSKFEPTYARRAFPCFDEPGFKAEFSVRLVHPTGNCYSALSNMNVESSVADTPAPGLTTVTFARSVPMSTYLACFIISDFVAVTAKAKGLNDRTFPVSVYTTRAQKSKGTFALNIGVKAIEYYINLFKIDYPLPKLDMAAIPDFVSGAMENWGLVTYREARLLYDSKITSTSNKKGIVTVVAHEFAHMWFGNLVTMAWWNDLWLNEGFATFMQFKCADAILPDWGLMDEFLIDEVHPVFATDATLSSHPIVQTVSSPDEITAIFDTISYNKGSSVLRMLENFLGPELFYGGITVYLNKFAYQNAETKHLFQILQEAVGTRLNLIAIMDTWTRQMGFPVVNVSRSGNVYTLKQKRFLADAEAKYDPNESNYRYRWTIPITYTTNENSRSTLVWFDKDQDDLVIKVEESVKWVKFNKDQVGYYRVNYEEKEWNLLATILQSDHMKFSASDRTHLLEDAFSLAGATELEYKVPLSLSTYLTNESHHAPWAVASSKLKAINKLLASTTIADDFRNYVKKLVDKAYQKVTWNVNPEENHITLSLRSTIIDLACAVGHRKCLQEAGTIFTHWINDTNDIRPHPDIRSLVYYYGMSFVGGEAEWDIMFERFINEGDAMEKLKLMRGLAGIRSAEILKKFINLAFNETYIRAQDFFSCMINIAGNPVGTPLVWDWIRENWGQLVKRYTLNDRYLGKLIPSITNSFSSELKLEEMKAFFQKYSEAGAGVGARAQALETVSNNIKWLNKNTAKLESWLADQSSKKLS
ncbi:glutamyl aminopeptidase isoform X2 [Cephus cinctus]|uniref:Aminopeptidase n=1 Tax=Cephus cinctus TaxID=211228 RepID=A0AAJ7BNA3_CEPCN|nr:glutamyl aminopeptidase isoform X2 [Cephus cinctus]